MLTLKWSDFSFKKVLYVLLFLAVIQPTFAQDTYADTLNCSGGTPTFIVDLTDNPDSVWTSASVSRAGSCCTPPDNNCVQFVITLAPESEGIFFNIPPGCGATPGGALFYQVDCGPQTNLGLPVCLDGTGPFILTFCKPGANTNCFSIESFQAPTTSGDVTVSDDCSADLSVEGLVEATVTWTSIAPFLPGFYNGLLDCFLACDDVTFTPGAGTPSSVSYQVCGTPLNVCLDPLFCEVITVTVVDELEAAITPVDPTICFGDPGVALTATPTGGAPPYTYLWNTGETTATITATGGTYYVDVLDSTGCTTGTDTVTVTEYMSDITANAGTDITECGSPTPTVNLNGTITGSTTAIWTGGAGTFVSDATELNATYSPTAAEITAGSVTLTLTTTDNGACPAASDDMTIVLTTFSGTVSDANSNISCFGGTDGAIDLTIAGGALPYTYLWNTGATTEDISGLPIGTYTCTITDANGCIFNYSTTLTEPAVLSVSSTPTNVDCFGGNNGSIDVTVTGGTTPFDYLWDTGATTEDLTDLTAGNYNLTVTDANGCTGTITVTITEPTVLALTATSTNLTCNLSADGEIDITPTGGTLPYAYLWSTGQTTEDLTGLMAGNYDVTVTDANGCEITALFTLTEPTLLEATAITSEISCFGGTDGAIDLTVTGGTLPYTYLWNTGATIEDISGLPIGTYNCTITDANGCIFDYSTTLTEPAVLSLSTAPTNVSCFGGNNGSIDITVTGGTAPFDYLWDTGATTEDLTDLTAGNYNLTVTDANGCTETIAVAITEPIVLALTSSSTNLPCNLSADGEIDITPSGGTLPYIYLWSTGQTTEDLTGLMAGNYDVTVTDANGCEITALFAITEPAPLEATAITGEISCFGGTDGTIDLTVTGGTAPYTYLWDTGETTQDISGLPIGTYTCTITDANGCNITTTYTLTEPTALTASGDVENVSCFAAADGTISITTTGGTAPYSYLWDTGDDTAGLSDLPDGDYAVTVTDDLGCSVDLNFTITTPLELSLTATLTDLTCFMSADGSIDINVSGGTAPYSFAWDTGETTEDLMDLDAGTYAVTITDANGCEIASSFTLTQPAVLAATTVNENINCFGEANGAVDLTTTGGTLPYTYLWNTGVTTEDLADLTIGTYTVTVTDDNGCEIVTTATLTEPEALFATSEITDASCFSLADGAIDVTATGGVLPHTYLWSTGAEIKDLDLLAAGAYDLTVTDDNGCEFMLGATVEEPALLVATAATTDKTCPDLDDGTASLTVTGGTEPYAYNWSTSETVADISGLAEGTYAVAVTDANGCTANTNATISTPEDFTAGEDSSVVFCNGEGTIALTDFLSATTTGTWSEITPTGQFNAATGMFDLTGLPAGEYDFVYTIPTYTPCTVTMATVSVTVHTTPALVFVANKNEGCDQVEVQFTSSSDVDLAECKWDFGDGETSTECGVIRHFYSTSGTYNVQLDVVSVDGCEATYTEGAFITIVPSSVADFSFSPDLLDISNTEVMFTNYSSESDSYEWNFGDGTPLDYDYEPTHQYPIEGNKSYTVELVAYNSIVPACADTIEQVIFIKDVLLLYVPNSFTPNGNSFNNEFLPVVTAGVDVYDYHLTIFNRWGEVMFESFDISTGWSGTYGINGELCMDGVYVWQIDFKETMSDKRHEMMGNVNLLR